MAALIAANDLSASNMQLQASITKLSSGSRIVTPADDAGGLAVSMKLSAQANTDSATETNITDATSFLQTQDGAMQVAGTILNRMSELATLAQDPTKSSTDVGNYQSEFATLNTELTTIAGSSFNGISMFGSASVGSVAGVALSAEDLTTAVSGVTSANVSTSATGAATAVTAAIQALASERATNGAQQSQLGYAGTLTTNDETNMTAASGNITDVDVASESTNLAKWNVLVQSGAAMLAQANQVSQIALKLLQ
jgi:flagellin